MEITGLHHIAILSSDRDRALSFYKALGFRIASEHPRPQWGDIVTMLRCGNVTLELFAHAGHPERPTNPEAYGARHIALVVPDVADAVGALEKAGFPCQPIRQDSFVGGRMAFVHDPDGLPIELHEQAGDSVVPVP